MSQPTDTVETARLTLRAFRAEDVEPLYQIQRDPAAMRYTYVALSRQDAAERLRAYAALAEQLGFAPWTVIQRATTRIIGWGGLNIDPFDPGWGVEVAYFFDPAYWGQGLATELVDASLQHGFARHDLGE
ncbi:MAG TPA: GNAT family N-acetyltransferase, partial [Caldilineaceae bacterium]|nr:GNAT family N-acetyltransferase [Caldilineaceae bacterium]